eukprot:30546-Pelagococcus_subviridis.AAC.1
MIRKLVVNKEINNLPVAFEAKIGAGRLQYLAAAAETAVPEDNSRLKLVNPKRRIIKKKKNVCEHGRQRYTCKECGGAGICEHGREKRRCKECGGTSLCKHGLRRYSCKHCGSNNGICEHGKERRRCKDCVGVAMCKHKREKRYCLECGGSSLCTHGRQKSKCKDCGGASICLHNRLKYTCKQCGGASICEHGRMRNRQLNTGGSMKNAEPECTTRTAAGTRAKAKGARGVPRAVPGRDGSAARSPAGRVD